MKKSVVTLGIDIGGTSTKMGIVSPEGEVLAFSQFPSRAQETFEDFLKDLILFVY